MIASRIIATPITSTITIIIVEALNKVFENCSCLGGFALALGCSFGALLLECGLFRWLLELGLDVGELGYALARRHDSEFGQQEWAMIRFTSGIFGSMAYLLVGGSSGRDVGIGAGFRLLHILAT